MERIGNRNGLYICTYTLRLEDGHLVLQGLDPSGAGASTFAVLGGTGSHESARGVATLIDSSAGTEFAIRLIG